MTRNKLPDLSATVAFRLSRDAVTVINKLATRGGMRPSDLLREMVAFELERRTGKPVATRSRVAL
jgi:hypothetical protein